jgi:hypothetical protein
LTEYAGFAGRLVEQPATRAWFERKLRAGGVLLDVGAEPRRIDEDGFSSSVALPPEAPRGAAERSEP